MRKDYILKFDVAMNDITCMHVIDSSDNLSSQDGGGLFSEEQLFHEELIEWSVAGQFQ